MPKHALAEIPKELPDELFSQISSALATNPKADIGQVVGDFIQRSPELMGAIALMGGAGGAMKAQQDARTNAGSQQSSPGARIPQNTTSGDRKPLAQPSTPPLSVADSGKLIDNVSKMPPEAQLHPQVQADLEQARKVVAGDTASKAQPRTPPLSVEDSRNLIENVSKMPPEAQQHPQVQADLEQARKVVEEGEAKKEVQTQPGDSSTGNTGTPSDSQTIIPVNTTKTADGRPATVSGGEIQIPTASDKSAAASGKTASSSSNPPVSAASGPQSPPPNTGSAVPSANNAKKANTTRRGVKRNNPKDWKDTMKLWDTVGYQDLLSPANRALIQNELVPIVDDAWIKFHPEDAGLKGEKISIHHVQGLPLNVPLPYSRHKDAHKPGGFRYNPGGVGSQLPVYSA